MWFLEAFLGFIYITSVFYLSSSTVASDYEVIGAGADGAMYQRELVRTYFNRCSDQ